MKGFLFPHPPILAHPANDDAYSTCHKTIEAMKVMADLCIKEKPDVIIYITAHGPIFNDAVMVHPGPDLKGNLNSVDYHITIDEILTSKLQIYAGKKGIPLYAITKEIIEDFHLSEDLDYGVMVPLSYMPELQSIPAMYLTYGYLSPEQLYDYGRTVRELIDREGLNALVVASGDLSHCSKEDGPYQFDQRGADFDAQYMKAIREVAINDMLFISTEGAMECGKRCLDILLGFFDVDKLSTKVHSYDNPYGVGYACVEFLPVKGGESKLEEIRAYRKHLSINMKEKEGEIVSFIRNVIIGHLKGEDDEVNVDKIPESLKVFTRGSFVSIHDMNGLRGCMGNIGGIRTFLYEDLKQNAIKAATQDPRFHPMTLEELDLARISVDLLSKPERIENLNHQDPKKYGLIVENEETHGLLLPDLEGINDANEQLRICLSKAGISPQSVYKMYRFTVERFY